MDYYQKYLKYKKKYLNLKNQFGGDDNCLNNYHSSLFDKGATGRTDCWADSGIFLLFGNPKLKNLVLEKIPELKTIFDTMLVENTINYEMRMRILNYFNITEVDLRRDGDLFNFIFNEKIQQILSEENILFTMEILDQNINNIINNDGINYKLHSCSILDHGHFISIFECNEKWYVADNTVPNLVEYNLELGYTPKMEETFDETIIGKNFNLKNKLSGYYLYLPVEVEPVEPIDSLQEMPQLCLGTSNWINGVELSIVIKEAIKIGYRHFDGAVDYERQSQSYDRVSKEEYYEGFKKGILEGLAENGLDRKDIWITFKSPRPLELDYIKSYLSELQYIDLWLYHYGRNGNEENVSQHIKSGFVKNWGTSNEYGKNDYSQIIESKPLHTNQIQARPDKSTKELIGYLNSIDVSVMLYSPISALVEDVLISLKYGPDAKYLNSIIKFYLQKYVYGKKNVLMVGSVSKSSLERNFKLFNSREPLLPEENKWLLENYFKFSLRHM